MSKVSIVGAGFVGEMASFAITQREFADEVVLVDIIEDMPKGKGLDQREATSILGSDTKIRGSNDYADISGSDIVVITAGVPRKPGMDRMDLLNVNLKICTSVVTNIKQYAPNAIILYVANPVDVLTYAAKQISGFPSNRVFGMAGVLDTARYNAFISMEAGVSVKDIRAMVLGGHGDAMVPLVDHTTISGIPLKEFLPQDKIDAIVQRTRKGGGEIVNLFRNVGFLGSAYYAPGNAIAQMCEAIIKDQKRVLPVVAFFEGQYGYNDIYAGIPAILGRKGIEKVLEINLSAKEMEDYKVSLDHVKSGVEEMKKLLNGS